MSHLEAFYESRAPGYDLQGEQEFLSCQVTFSPSSRQD